MTLTPTPRLRTALLMLAGLGTLAAAAWVSRRLFESPETPAGATRVAEASAVIAAPAPAPDLERTFQVVSATGRVEAEHGGTWAPIKPGDTLTRSDVVRTSAASGAVLRLANGAAEIELRAGVEIQLGASVGPLEGATPAATGAGGETPPSPTQAGAANKPAGKDGTGANVDLRRGKVLARVNAAGALAITSKQTRTTTAGPARFVVLADEKGRVSVAAIEGSARFTAAGKSVDLPAGTTSASQAGAPPGDPEHIPEDVFLNVVWPTVERHADRAEIKGRATPSSIVTVRAPSGMETAAVGADGQFSVTVPVGSGKTPVEVEAEDLAGRTRQATSTLSKRAPPPPALTPEATDLWKRQANK
jgi:hypothetical protein